MTQNDSAGIAATQGETYDHHRLLRMEGRLRALQITAAVALVVAVAALGIGGSLLMRDRYGAEAFTVTDADGREVAQLGLSSEGRPGLYIYDGTTDATRMWLGLDRDGAPQVVLAGPGGENLLSLTLDPEQAGQPRLYLQDTAGTTGLAAGIGADGNPGMVFMDAEGQTVLALPPVAGATPEERWVNLNDAGTRAFVQGRFAEAERLYQAAIQAAQAFGERDLRLAASLNNLGALYVKADQLDAADRVYQRSLAIRRQALGEAHPQIAQSLANIAFLRRSQGLPTEAADLYLQAIAMWEQLGGEGDPRLAGTLAGYAELLDSQGQGAAAGDYRKRAEEIRARAAAP